ncbi:MAG TPA: GGDEF domain-containing protein [Terriglobales bacterium]|nr:GGDEF domain-containing protein [Terriglobales bacterium]
MGARFLRTLYRLVIPGGLVLLAAAVSTHAGMSNGLTGSFWIGYPYFIFGTGLLLSAIFKCSRLFFALLIIAVSDRVLVWLMPSLSAVGIHRTIFDFIALLLPFNLLALAFMRDRGIVSPLGRQRVAFIVAQIALVAAVVLVHPVQVRAANLVHGQIVPSNYSEWSQLSQPALVMFILAGVLMLIYLMRRRRPVESGLFWTLVTAFLALNAGTSNHVSSAYFATGGLILSIAVLETSYTLAYRDELTQLPSRRALNEALGKIGEKYAVAMVDVDHFKQFNDTYGHETGDQVLQMIASRLEHVEGGGKAFRYGGEEFAVIFPNKSVDDAYPNLETLRKSIEATPFNVRQGDRRKEGSKRKKNAKRARAKNQVQVTVSIGAADSAGDKSPTEQVLGAADKALYRAKNSGRNCTAVSV